MYGKNSVIIRTDRQLIKTALKFDMKNRYMNVPVIKIKRCIKCASIFCCITLVAQYMCIYGVFKEENTPVITPVKTGALSSSTLPQPQRLQSSLPQLQHVVQPKRHIGLLKVHKAASSTLQNIIIRFGLANNLTFVLPTKKSPPEYSHVISVVDTVKPEYIVDQPPGRSFDILCHHVVYNQLAWNATLPRDTMLIGSVREPTSHFRSVLQYFRPQYIIRITDFDKVATFLQAPYMYEIAVPYSVTNNRMSFEYGVSEDVILKRDVEAFEKYLTEVLNKNFAIVLVMEILDESLVLMKRKLNWSLKDIIYVRKNSYNIAVDSELTMDDDLIPLLQKHNPLDYMLYDFFKSELEKQIIDERKHGFDDEVNTFISIRDEVVRFCHSRTDWSSSVTVNATRWNEAFVWTRKDCSVLLQDEVSLTEMLRHRQYPETKVNSRRKRKGQIWARKH